MHPGSRDSQYLKYSKKFISSELFFFSTDQRKLGNKHLVAANYNNGCRLRQIFFIETVQTLSNSSEIFFLLHRPKKVGKYISICVVRMSQTIIHKKIHSLCRDLNPRSLDYASSVITITPQKG